MSNIIQHQYRQKIEMGEPSWWTLRVHYGDRFLDFSILPGDVSSPKFFTDNTLIESVKWQSKLHFEIQEGTGEFTLFAAEKKAGAGEIHLWAEKSLSFYRNHGWLIGDQCWLRMKQAPHDQDRMSQAPLVKCFPKGCISQ